MAAGLELTLEPAIGEQTPNAAKAAAAKVPLSPNFLSPKEGSSKSSDESFNKVIPQQQNSNEKDEEISQSSSEALIWDIYTDFIKEDEGVPPRALMAYLESLNDPEDSERSIQGVVARRTPFNPLARKPITSKDPALKNNPLLGRLVALLTTTAALFFVFFQALAYNKYKYGYTLTHFNENGMLGPTGETLFALGGLNTNAIRNEDGVYRVFWACWMHSGWIHIIFNVLCQIQFFFMFEPDWGFWRSFLIFSVAGVTGNLLSSVADPCTTTVGSSGGLFGLMGAMIPYCIEYWTTIPRPWCILAFSIIVIFISIMIGFTGNTDNWAHMGGLLGGLLFSFATITAMTAFTNDEIDSGELKISKFFLENGELKKKKINKFEKIAPKCKHGYKEWFVRVSCMIGLVSQYMITSIIFIKTFLWILLFILLLHTYEFQPTGQLTFSSKSGCTCCWRNVEADPTPRRSKVPWMCFQADVRPETWRITWGEFCQMSIAEISASSPLPAIDSVGRLIVE